MWQRHTSQLLKTHVDDITGLTPMGRQRRRQQRRLPCKHQATAPTGAASWGGKSARGGSFGGTTGGSIAALAVSRWDHHSTHSSQWCRGRGAMANDVRHMHFVGAVEANALPTAVYANEEGHSSGEEVTSSHTQQRRQVATGVQVLHAARHGNLPCDYVNVSINATAYSSGVLPWHG